MLEIILLFVGTFALGFLIPELISRGKLNVPFTTHLCSAIACSCISIYFHLISDFVVYNC